MKYVDEVRKNEVYRNAMRHCLETEQNNPHHIYSVGVHICAVVGHLPADMKTDEILVISAMLHDIGKPDVKETKADGTDKFVGHAKRSAEIAAQILDETSISEEKKREILWLVSHHEIGDPVKAKTMKKWLNEVTKETVEKLFVLRIADIEGQSDYKKEEKLTVVRTNLETLSSVLEEEEEGDKNVNTLLKILEK
jgi:tRNA nucleotidyltransferase (CCA-adding enzyme)